MNADQNRPQALRNALPLYRCHKTVRALKIKAIQQAPADQERIHAGGDWLLIPEDGRHSPITVGHDKFVAKHSPQPGGYYVVYEDGYASYSPAKAFEEGYTLEPEELDLSSDQPLQRAEPAGNGETCESCQ